VLSSDDVAAAYKICTQSLHDDNHHCHSHPLPPDSDNNDGNIHVHVDLATAAHIRVEPSQVCAVTLDAVLRAQRIHLAEKVAMQRLGSRLLRLVPVGLLGGVGYLGFLVVGPYVS